MTLPEFEAIGGTVTQQRRNPPETRYLAELPHHGTTVRWRDASVAAAIAGVMARVQEVTRGAADR